MKDWQIYNINLHSRLLIGWSFETRVHSRASPLKKCLADVGLPGAQQQSWLSLGSALRMYVASFQQISSLGKSKEGSGALIEGSKVKQTLNSTSIFWIINTTREWSLFGRRFSAWIFQYIDWISWIRGKISSDHHILHGWHHWVIDCQSFITLRCQSDVSESTV